ncbi:DUF2851 family protein [Bizionia sp. KMM 8389]
MTTDGNQVHIVNTGRHNQLSGPDFFAAQVRIGDQLWGGNVEIHIKSSDWYVHNHETDAAYLNVILHVVWEHDTDVFRKNNIPIPTLELKPYVDTQVLTNYQQLFSKNQNWINCEKQFHAIPDFILNNWLERLYIERLEEKSVVIFKLLKQFKNDWEAVLFILISKSFGLNINGDSFLSMAQSLDFKVVRKTQKDPLDLEALFFGQLQLLDADSEEPYEVELFKKYRFLKNKFQLNNDHITKPQFFKLRPSNFPTIRLSQLASMYSQNPNLFSKVISSGTLNEFYNTLRVGCSNYWENHYTFQTASKNSKKILTKKFIDLLVINCIVPLKFAYSKSQGETNLSGIMELMSQVPLEKNTIVNRFTNLKQMENSARVSQGVIQLKTRYCNLNKCLDCAIGNHLISK